MDERKRLALVFDDAIAEDRRLFSLLTPYIERRRANEFIKRVLLEWFSRNPRNLSVPRGDGLSPKVLAQPVTFRPVPNRAPASVPAPISPVAIKPQRPVGFRPAAPMPRPQPGPQSPAHPEAKAAPPVVTPKPQPPGPSRPAASVARSQPAPSQPVPPLVPPVGAARSHPPSGRPTPPVMSRPVAPIARPQPASQPAVPVAPPVAAPKPSDPIAPSPATSPTSPATSTDAKIPAGVVPRVSVSPEGVVDVDLGVSEAAAASMAPADIRAFMDRFSAPVPEPTVSSSVPSPLGPEPAPERKKGVKSRLGKLM